MISIPTQLIIPLRMQQQILVQLQQVMVPNVRLDTLQKRILQKIQQKIIQVNVNNQ